MAFECDALTAFNLAAARKACTDGAFSIIPRSWILKVLSLQYGGQAGGSEGWFTLQTLLAQKGCIIAATWGVPSQLLLIYRAAPGGLEWRDKERMRVCVCVCICLCARACVCVCVVGEELDPLLTQNSFGLQRSNSFVALPPSSPSPVPFFCFSFLAVRCLCWQENPPHPHSHGLDTEMGWRGGRGQRGNGSDGKGRGL